MGRRQSVTDTHGTKLMQLKPASIVQAAHADLKLRDAKKEKKADPELQYSFARKHVQRAVSVGHLVALAYFDPGAANSTDKRSTYIVYQDRSLLKQTLIQLLTAPQEEPQPQPQPQPQPELQEQE
jgi:hypothetical protein